MDWVKDEISRMSKGGRIAVYAWMWVIVAGWILATIFQTLYGHYADAAAEALIFAYIFAVKWLWSLGIARAIRKRDGKFGNWYAVAFIFGLVLTAIFYAAKWNGKPVLPEYRNAE